MSGPIEYPEWVYTPDLRRELNAEERITREAFYRGGLYDIDHKLSDLSAEILGWTATLSEVATLLCERYLRFERMKSAHVLKIPGAGCEADMAFYRRPEINDPHDAMWELSQRLDPAILSQEVYDEEKEVEK